MRRFHDKWPKRTQNEIYKSYYYCTSVWLDARHDATNWIFHWPSLLKYIEKFIPFIALAILGYLGTKMIWDGTHPCKDGEECKINQNTTIKAILIQGVATSIDALSVGFSFPGYTQIQAIVAVSIIALATFAICFAGVLIGKRFGDKLGNKAVIIGGSILILIGIEICITSFI